MTYTLHPDQKPGFVTVVRTRTTNCTDGMGRTKVMDVHESAVFSHFLKDESSRYVLARVPTEFGTGWIIVGECVTFTPETVLEGLAGSFNVPQEAWT